MERPLWIIAVIYLNNVLATFEVGRLELLERPLRIVVFVVFEEDFQLGRSKTESLRNARVTLMGRGKRE